MYRRLHYFAPKCTGATELRIKVFWIIEFFCIRIYRAAENHQVRWSGHVMLKMTPVWICPFEKFKTLRTPCIVCKSSNSYECSESTHNEYFILQVCVKEPFVDKNDCVNCIFSRYVRSILNWGIVLEREKENFKVLKISGFAGKFAFEIRRNLKKQILFPYK